MDKYYIWNLIWNEAWNTGIWNARWVHAGRGMDMEPNVEWKWKDIHTVHGKHTATIFIMVVGP